MPLSFFHSICSKPDNVRDHRAGTSDHPFQKRAQVRLRVHHIVIRPLVDGGFFQFFVSNYRTQFLRDNQLKKGDSSVEYRYMVV